MQWNPLVAERQKSRANVNPPRSTSGQEKAGLTTGQVKSVGRSVMPRARNGQAITIWAVKVTIKPAHGAEARSTLGHRRERKPIDQPQPEPDPD